MKASARGQGFEFGDASTDKLVLYALLGVGIFVLASAGKGLAGAFSNIGDSLKNLTGTGAKLTGAVDSAVTGIQSSGQSLHDRIVNNTPDAVPIPGFGPINDDGTIGPAMAPPLEGPNPAFDSLFQGGAPLNPQDFPSLTGQGATAGW